MANGVVARITGSRDRFMSPVLPLPGAYVGPTNEPLRVLPLRLELVGLSCNLLEALKQSVFASSSGTCEQAKGGHPAQKHRKGLIARKVLMCTWLWGVIYGGDETEGDPLAGDSI